jgi:hypothetical protein
LEIVRAGGPSFSFRPAHPFFRPARLCAMGRWRLQQGRIAEVTAADGAD